MYNPLKYPYKLILSLILYLFMNMSVHSFIHLFTCYFIQAKVTLHQYCTYLRSGSLRETLGEVSRESLGDGFSHLSYHSVPASLDEIPANPVGLLQGEDTLPHPHHLWSATACLSRGRSKVRKRVRGPRAGTPRSRIKDRIVSPYLRFWAGEDYLRN